MMQIVGRFLKLITGYSLVTVLTPLLNVLLTPFYTYVLSPFEYGILDVGLTFQLITTTIVLLGFDQVLSSRLLNGDKDYQQTMIKSVLFIVTVTGFAVAIVIYLLASNLTVLFFQDNNKAYILQLLSISIAVIPIYNLAVVILKLQMNVRQVNILGLCFIALLLLSNVIFVFSLHLGIAGVILANSIAYGLGSILSLYFLRASWRANFSLALIQSLLTASLYIVPAILSWTLLANANRLILTQFVSPTDLGIFAIANKIAMLMTVLFGAVWWSAWFPIAMPLANNQEAPGIFARMFEYCVAFFMLAALIYGSFAPELLAAFINVEYQSAAPHALLLITFAGPLLLIASFFNFGLYIRQRLHILSLIYLGSALVNIVVTIWLAPIFGIWAAGWASIAGGITLIIFSYKTGQNAFFVPYRLWRFFLLFASYATIIAIYLIWPALFHVKSLKVVAVLFFISELFILRIVSWTDLRQMYISLGRRPVAVVSAHE